jgi:competence protein ComEC
VDWSPLARRPLLTVSLACLAGVVLPGWATLAGGLLAAVAGLVAPRLLGRPIASSIALALAAGSLLQPTPAPIAPGGAASGIAARTFALSERPRPGGHGWSARGVAAAPDGSVGEVLVVGHGPPPDSAAGSQLSALARWLPPDPPRLARLRIATGSPVARIELPSEPVDPARARSWRARSTLRDGLSEGTAGVALALILGERGAVSPRDRALFVDTGTAHLLAISGLHLAWVAALSLVLLRRALLRVPRLRDSGWAVRASGLAAIAVCVAFTGATGAQVSTVRAAWMATLVLAAATLGRRSDGATALGLAAVAIAASGPEALGNPGFHLSFSAVAGLLLANARPRDPIGLDLRTAEVGRWGRAARWFLGGVAASTVAHLATLPLCALHFGRVAWLSPVANVFAIPYAGAVLMPACLIAAAAVHLPEPMPAVGLWVLEHSVAGLIEGLVWLRPYCGAAWVPRPSLLATLAALLAAGLLIRAATHARPGYAALALGLFAASAAPALERGDGLLHAVFLDVGHGDAAVIVTPNGRAVLVDGGGRAQDAGRTGWNTIGPELSRLGVTSLDLVVATHPDADHIQGLLPVLASFPVGRLWWNGRLDPSPALVALLATAAARGTPIEVASAGTGWTLDGVRIDVLHPSPRPDGEDWGRNDASLVLEVRYGEFSALLTGDVEARGELAAAARRTPGPVSVLKVAHHGSLTSSCEAFIRATSPVHAVFSTDEAAPYGLPRPQVLERYEAQGSRIHRTDRDGAVHFATDGDRLWQLGAGP